ncbi:MAG TPA: hypothetical protein VGK24_13060 [Candidatus Angelobacter sp.]|jgi:hypothetical protein
MIFSGEEIAAFGQFVLKFKAVPDLGNEFLFFGIKSFELMLEASGISDWREKLSFPLGRISHFWC